MNAWKLGLILSAISIAAVLTALPALHRHMLDEGYRKAVAAKNAEYQATLQNTPAALWGYENPKPDPEGLAVGLACMEHKGIVDERACADAQAASARRGSANIKRYIPDDQTAD